MAPSYPKSNPDIYALRGRYLIEKFDEDLERDVAERGAPTESVDTYGTPQPVVPIIPDTPRPPVGIIGAGAGGLYTALMLQTLDIPYEIMEASDRTGGRLFTFHFNKEVPHDYYDVGAMRFPETDIMIRLFHLFGCEQMNEKGINLKSHLIPYIFRNEEGFLLYNGIRHRQKDVPPTSGNDDFNFQSIPGNHDAGDVSHDYTSQGFKELVNAAINPFIAALEKDLKEGTQIGWRRLMLFDQYSTRGYMADCLKYPLTTINWLETMDKSSGWYDKSLTETVLEEIAFGTQPDIKWFCLDGGSQVLSDSLEKYVKDNAPNALQFDKFVSAIQQVEDDSGGTKAIRLTVKGEEEAREYQHVISTMPLPCLRTIDTDNAGLTWRQKNALRQLQYGPSIKVGVKFKHAWWSSDNTKDGEPINIVGGQSYTDRCIRTVVYPSYGLPGTEDPTSVLIASYCWTDDALRMGALIKNEHGAEEERLKELVLRDLAAVHNVEYDFLKDLYVDHFAWDWTHSPLTQGAFAFFGPGNFETLYTSMTHPAANGRLHFAGEALSVRHAWVVGALDSAWRSVRQVLLESYPDKVKEFENLWGNNMEWQRAAQDNSGHRRGHQERDLLLRHIKLQTPHLFEKSKA